MIETTYDKVALWNKRCDKTPAETGTEEYWEALSNQAKRIEEELKELTDAIEDRDLVETFDALLDLDVVVSGGLFLSNGDYAGGIEAVLENNDNKYTDRKETAYAVDNHYKDLVATRVHEVSVGDIFDSKFYSVHRVSDDKILKFPGHPQVNLAPFAPKGGG
jgi:hypothetical protein